MYAHVAVARPFANALTYAVPAWMAGKLQVGHVVLVPLGKAGETGYITGLADTTEVPRGKIKPISRLLDPIPAFGAEQLAFFEWIAGYYFSPLGMVIHTALPSRMRAKTVRGAEPTEEGTRALAARTVEGRDAQVLREVIRRPGTTKRGLVRRLDGELESNEVEAGLKALERAEQLTWVDREVGETKGRVKTVELVGTREEAEARLERAGSVMTAVLGALAEATGAVPLRTLVERFGSGARGASKRMEAAGAVAFGEVERLDPLKEAVALGPSEAPALNPDQLAALAAIDAADAMPFLLFGVTGSGKTEVFLGAARHALAEGRQVLVLVPEIGLTPQLVGRFKARFGDDVAVLHSGLTAAQRLTEWRRIRAGEASVAVGARSALFAPFQSLGLIVVDEEHDDSYKQDDGVPYSARDLAVVLGQRHGCPTVLATATPSLESWYNAKNGRYTLLELPKRATAMTVPVVELIDLTEMTWAEGTARPLFAPEVVASMRQAFDDGGKVIVLYNRRGYATQVQCTACGAAWECPNCGIAMTLHKGIGRISCHYCALSLRYTDACPVCKLDSQEELGKGTEQVEEVLRELFPDIPLARMDADTTSGRGSHHRILSDFREGRTRMLVGTQIVAKGHDFPDVHVAVVVSADRGFRIPDFRSAERTFALLVQLAGRAGRGDVQGRVLVQTWNPDHYVLKHLHDVRGFLRTELRLRTTLGYPPVTRMCLIRLDGVNRREVERAARELGSRLRDAGARFPGTTVLGPAPAALPRLVGRWRYQILLRGDRVGPYRSWLRAAAPMLGSASRKGIRVTWDVDPRHLM